MLLTRDESRGMRWNNVRWPVILAIAGLVPLVAAVSAKADPPSMSFESTPVTDAVAQIDRTFDAQITIKPGVDVDRTVTFDVPNIGDVGARLEAVDDLANALGASYAKTFVISRSIDEIGTANPAIDAVGAPVVFPNGPIPAEDAIRTVAGVDDATVQFYSTIHGTVTFTSNRLTADEAARQIAEQTHTVWKAYYAIAPKQAGSASGAYGDKIIGYTAAGSPITELPVGTFQAGTKPVPAPEQPVAKPTDTASDTSKPAKSSKDQTAATDQNTETPNGYGYPYGYPGYYYGGYPGYNSGYGNSTMVIGPGGSISSYGMGYGPFGGYGNAGYGSYGGYGFGNAGNGVYYPYGGYYGGGATVIGGSPITGLPSFSTGGMY